MKQEQMVPTIKTWPRIIYAAQLLKSGYFRLSKLTHSLAILTRASRKIELRKAYSRVCRHLVYKPIGL